MFISVTCFMFVMIYSLVSIPLFIDSPCQPSVKALLECGSMSLIAVNGVLKSFWFQFFRFKTSLQLL